MIFQDFLCYAFQRVVSNGQKHNHEGVSQVVTCLNLETSFVLITQVLKSCRATYQHLLMVMERLGVNFNTNISKGINPSIAGPVYCSMG